MNFDHHLCKQTSRCKQPQAIQSALSPGEWEGAHRAGCAQHWAVPRPECTDTMTGSGLLQIGMTSRNEAKKSLPQPPGEPQLLNTKKGMNIHKQLSLHHKKASTKVSCPTLTLLHGQGQVLPMPWLQNSSPWANPEQGACISARLGPKQHKMSWTMPCKTLQKQKWRLQSQLALGTTQKVCIKYLQGSSSSCHKTNLKYNEALVEKFLLKPARYHSGSSCLEKCFFS